MLVTFEGPEGGGKSTQIRLLAAALREEGHRVVETREPGGVPAAEAIRALVLHAELSAEAEALLFLAARAEHVRRRVAPELEAGAIVLCDRFNDSTIAYQGYGLGLDLELLRKLCAFAAAGVTPDLTFLLDLPPETGLRRRSGGRRSEGQLHLEIELAGGGEAINKMENRDLAFHRRVRQGFLTEAARDRERIYVVDAARPAAAIHEELLAEVRRRTGRR